MNDTLLYGGTTLYNYHWDFGDGTQTPFRNTTHTYTTAGCYTITLSVQDSTGKTTRTTTAAIIKENTTEPYIKIKHPKTVCTSATKNSSHTQTMDPRTNRHHGRNLLNIPNHKRQIP